MIKYGIAILLFWVYTGEAGAQGPNKSRQLLQGENNERTISKPDIHPLQFASGHTSLDSVSCVYLDTVALYLRLHPGVKITLGAHTDGKGSEKHNIELSEIRANTCLRYLLMRGVPKERVSAVGFGNCCPLVKETTNEGKDVPEARAQNRRVEIMITEE